MLTANTALQVGTFAAAGLDTQFDELAHALDIDGLERVGIQDLVAEVVAHERSDIVAAEAEGHLGKVVGTEGEELGGTGHAVGGQGGTRDLDHRTELVVDVLHLDAFYLGFYAVADGFLETQLTGGDGHRDHDFRHRVQTLDQQLGGCLEDGFVLGLGDEREAHVQTDTAVTHHRVHLMQGFAALLDFLDGDAQVAGNLFLLFLGLGHELVKRRVQETEDDGLAVHDLQRALDGGLHVRLQVGQGGLALFVRVAKNHLAQFGQRGLGVLAVEHVLDTEQTDAFGTELEGLRGILGRIGIGADTNLAELVHHIHEFDEERILGSVHRADLGTVNQTLRAVQRQPVAFTIDLAAFGEGDGLVLEIDLHGVAAYDAAFTPAAGHEGCVGGHTAPHGQDTGRGTHAFDILRRGLFADQDGLLAGSGGFHGSLGGKDDGADGSTRGSGQTLGQDRGFLLGGRVEDRVQDFIQLGRGDPHYGGLFVDHAFFHHIGRHLQGGQTGTLANTALQHPQVTFLDGEFDILHVLEVIFQFQTDLIQLFIYFGHRLLKRYQIFVFLALGRLIERVRGPDTGHHILALGVDQPFAIEPVVTVGRVAGESHTRSGGFAHVAEHH